LKSRYSTHERRTSSDARKGEPVVLEGRWLPSARPLLRRETRSLRPPIFLEHSLSGGDNGRDRLFKAQSGLIAGSAKNPISLGNLAVILRQPPRFEIRADNGRFPFYPLFPKPGFATRDLPHDLGLFFPRCVSCLNSICGCFFETGMLSACLAFFDLCVFPLGSAWKIMF
jgi:hypothetical protein